MVLNETIKNVKNICEPDQISVRPVEESRLKSITPKFELLLKTAREMGWFCHPPKVTLTKLSEQVGMARATVAEMLSGYSEDDDISPSPLPLNDGGGRGPST